MPSKRKKADLKGGTDVFAEMLEKTTLDDRTTRLVRHYMSFELLHE